MRIVRVRVPATSGNLGPGFDVLGLALGLHDVVTLRASEPLRQAESGNLEGILASVRLKIRIVGEDAGSIPTDRTNLVWRAASAIFRRAGRIPDALEVRIRQRIPLARGLGSSAAACVAGALGANLLCNAGLKQEELLDDMAKLEGHADNAAAVLLGGLTACLATESGYVARRLPIRAVYQCVVCVPGQSLSTKAARAALPPTVAHEDAVFSLGRAVMLTALLGQGEESGLSEAMKDKLHQPFRQQLVPGLEEVIQAALDAGALGAAMSGAGPSVLALIRRGDKDQAHRVGEAMCNALARHGGSARHLCLSIDRSGAKARLLP